VVLVSDSLFYAGGAVWIIVIILAGVVLTWRD